MTLTYLRSCENTLPKPFSSRNKKKAMPNRSKLREIRSEGGRKCGWKLRGRVAAGRIKGARSLPFVCNHRPQPGRLTASRVPAGGSAYFVSRTGRFFKITLAKNADAGYACCPFLNTNFVAGLKRFCEAEPDAVGPMLIHDGEGYPERNGVRCVNFRERQEFARTAKGS